MASFSQKVKGEIGIINPKIKNCCAYSFLYGMTFPQNIKNSQISIKSAFAKNNISLHEKFTQLLQKKENSYIVNSKEILISSGIIRFSTIAEFDKNVFKCQHCKENFFRGLFLTAGTINSPEKSYRLELIFSNHQHANEILEYLNLLGIKFNSSMRGNKKVLYVKKYEMIEEFLALMGASNSAFEFINYKIENEVRNIANRATNCDAANINKSLVATQKYINAINELIKIGRFEELSQPLKEIAQERINNSDISLIELGKRFSPPISKSGVHHRLEKIYKFYLSVQDK